MLNEATFEFSAIYIACGYTDLRYGIDGLAPFMANTLFLFCGRRKDRIKGLVWEGDGFLMLYKRLEAGRFIWPKSEEEMRKMSKGQLKMLMSGFSIDSSISKIKAPEKVL